MSNHGDKVYFHHIIDCIDKIDQYIGVDKYNDFAKNDLLIDAIVRNFEIIGEASNNVSDEFKENHPEIDFRPAVSMRNWLAHGYDTVDLEIVWKTTKEDLPKLKEQLFQHIN